jgi:hypothetical protein
MLSWSERSRSAVHAAKRNWRGQHPFSRRVRRDYMAHSSSRLHDFAAEPPAHYRLVSGHDLFRRRGLGGLYRRDACARALNATGDRGVRYHDGSGPGSFLLVGQSDISPGADKIMSARPAAGVKAGRLAAREAGRLDARGSRRAKIGGGLVACRSHLRTTRQGSSPRRGRDGESGSGERGSEVEPGRAERGSPKQSSRSAKRKGIIYFTT